MRCEVSCLKKNEYLDESDYRICKPCDENCSACLGIAINCTSCNLPFYLDNSSCIESCPSPFWGDNETNKCVSSFINVDEYGDISDKRICKKCDLSCNTCEGEPNNCTSCRSPFFFNSNTSACISYCPSSFWGNNLSRRCEACNRKSETCSGSAKNCLSCHPSLYLDKIAQTCVTECPNPLWNNRSSRECEPCDSNCKTCSGTASKCLSCNSSLYLNINASVCVESCPNSFWGNNKTGSCEKCDDNCESCSGNAKKCLTCHLPLYLDLNTSKCLLGCPNENEFGGDNRICQKCDSNCKKCNRTAKSCLNCYNFSYLNMESLTCVTECPSPFWEINNTGKCEENCPNKNQFGDVSDHRICKKCDNNCATCRNSATNCLSCNFPLFLSENRCVNNCSEEFRTNNSSRKCEKMENKENFELIKRIIAVITAIIIGGIGGISVFFVVKKFCWGFFKKKIKTYKQLLASEEKASNQVTVVEHFTDISENFHSNLKEGSSENSEIANSSNEYSYLRERETNNIVGEDGSVFFNNSNDPELGKELELKISEIKNVEMSEEDDDNLEKTDKTEKIFIKSVEVDLKLSNKTSSSKNSTQIDHPEKNLENPVQSEWLREKYTLKLTRIGAGGFGVVYKFDDPNDKISKALKVIKKDIEKSDDEITRMTDNEIGSLLKLRDCPYVVILLDYYQELKGEQPKVLLVMELGKMNLKNLIQNSGHSLNEENLLKLIECLSGSLKYALDKNIHHRDIKPENIIVMQNEEFKLTDWGASKIVKINQTLQPHTIIGTPTFMAPELDIRRNKQRLDLGKADVFSCGLVLAESCGIRRKEIYKIKVESGLNSFENVLQVILNERFKDEIKKKMAFFIVNMCKVKPENRWGVEEFYLAFKNLKSKK